MAQLKIDLLVDDAGAAQTLANVEQGVQRVGKAAELTAEQLEHVKRQLAQGVDPSKIVLPGDEIAKQATTASAGLQKFSSTATVVERDWVKMGQSWQKTGREMSAVGLGLTAAVTAPILALGGFAVKSAIDFETSFAGVRKTVTATEAQFASLEKGVIQLSKTIPIGVNQLNKIMELGGQMGVVPQNLLRFTETIARLKVAAPDLNEEFLSMSVARLATLTGSFKEHGVDAYDRIASAVTFLGNNFKATEGEIINFGMRIAATAQIAGMTEGQILGIAAAFTEMGIKAEMGGSAFNLVVDRMTKAVVSGNMPLLNDIGAIAGFAGPNVGAQFQQAFRDDAGNAFVMFVEGLSRAGDKAGIVLDALGLKNVRVRQTFLSGAVAADVMRAALEGGTAAADRMKDHFAESDERFKTTASQLKLFANHAVALAIELGGQLIPHLMKLKPAAEMVMAGLTGVVKVFSEMPSWMQATVMGTFGLVAALGPLAFSFGNLITFGGRLLTLLGGQGLTSTLTTVGTSATSAGSALAGSGAAAAQASVGVGMMAHAYNMLAFAIKAAAVAGAGFVGWQIGKQIDDTKPGGLHPSEWVSAATAWAVANDPRYGTGMTWEDAKLGAKGSKARAEGDPAKPVEKTIEQEAQDRVALHQRENAVQAQVRQMSPELAALMDPESAKREAEAKQKANAARKAAEAAAKKWQQDLDRLSGREAVATVHEFQKKFETLAAEGIKPATDDLKKYNDALNASVDAMVRGLKVAEPLKRELLMAWADPKNQFASGIAPFASGMGQGSLDNAKLIADMKTLSERTIGWMGYDVAKGQAPELKLPPMPGLVSELSNQTIEDNRKSITEKHIPGFFENAFGLDATLKDAHNQLIPMSQQFGANLSSVLMQAITGGGNIGDALGGFLGGSLLGELGKKAASGIGGFLGGTLGTALGPLGTMLGSMVGDLMGKLTSKLGGLFGIGNAGRDLVKDFAADHGGFDSLHDKLGAMGQKGEELWIKLTQGVGRNNPEEAKKVIEEVGAALDAWPDHLFENIGKMASGTNARAEAFITPFQDAQKELDKLTGQFDKESVKLAKLLLKNPSKDDAKKALYGMDLQSQQSDQMRNTQGIEAQVEGLVDRLAELREQLQPDIERLGIFTQQTFATLVFSGQSAVEALTELKPAFDALNEGVNTFGLTSTPVIDHLLGMHAIVDQNRLSFEALAASGDILSGALATNVINIDLFKAISEDIGTNLQRIIDSGAPIEQALALAQPQLQMLWEAQQRLGFEADAATQALMDQAVQQGIVGPQMKDINKQILDVLVAIGDALGAHIPNALRGLPGVAQEAAKGMNDAFAGVRPPVVTDLGGTHTELPPGIDPNAGKGLSPASPGEPPWWDDTKTMHSGGLVGWRRMHSGGLASDEVPIIGQRGEYMVSRRGVAFLDSINRGQMPGGTGGNMTIVIQRPDGSVEAEYLMPYIAGEVRRLGLMRS